MKFTTLNVRPEAHKKAKLLSVVLDKPVYYIIEEALQLYEEHNGVKVSSKDKS